MQNTPYSVLRFFMSNKKTYAPNQTNQQRSYASHKKSLSLVTDHGLKKSTRCWDTTVRLEDLPLVSRIHLDSKEAKEKSLLNVEIQYGVWERLQEMAFNIVNKKDPKSWSSVVNLLRKLREGIYGSQWSEGNIEFSARVFEQSVLCNLQAHNHEELFKCLRVLVEEIYRIPGNHIKSYYHAMYAVLLILHDRGEGMRRIALLSNDKPENQFCKDIARCINTQNCPKFFHLYNTCPDIYFQLILLEHRTMMRQEALHILKTAYYSAPDVWISRCLGLKPQDTVSTLQQLIQPSCIDRIEDNVIYFVRTTRKAPASTRKKLVGL
ncbi:hypothetical protein BDF14DRAFT_1841578, partial [Spinellus fusiger]